MRNGRASDVLPLIPWFHNSNKSRLIFDVIWRLVVILYFSDDLAKLLLFFLEFPNTLVQICHKDKIHKAAFKSNLLGLKNLKILKTKCSFLKQKLSKVFVNYLKKWKPPKILWIIALWKQFSKFWPWWQHV